MSEPRKQPEPVETDDVALIDAMRAKGSFEAAQQRLTATARVIAERIVAEVPGQTWTFTNDANVQRMNRGGRPCEQLTGDIARRPNADTVEFGRPFDADEFAAASDVVRQEAAQYDATDQSSLFNEASRRDFDVRGNGYEFNLGQINVATLTITGDCFLLQRVVDLPPGQAPPEPPIVPTPPR